MSNASTKVPGVRAVEAHALVVLALLLNFAVAASAQPAFAQDQHQHHQHQHPSPTPAPSPRATPSPATGADHSGHQMPAPAAREPQASGPVLRLEELEALALKNNPTLAQAEAAVRAAEGRGVQAGLWPNPVVGYQAEELSFRAASETSEHFFFVEQTIPLGGKLGKARRVFEREADRTRALAEAQRLRVLNGVRALYFEALGAQRLVELRRDLARLSNEAVEITAELFNVGQADKPDQLEIEIEAQRAEVELLRAENDLERSWRLLAAFVGQPDLQRGRLAGNIEEAITNLEHERVLETLLRDSPEVRAARSEVERARAVLSRARAQRAPDLHLRGGLGYSNELLERDDRKVGPKGFFEAGITLPVFNRNQGGIATAAVELDIAEREFERLQLALRTRLAASFGEYRNSLRMAERYRTQIIPRARAAYEMYLSNFRQMAASYPQVLIAQRTLFQVEAEYARALVSLRRSTVGLQGFLLSGGLDPLTGAAEGGESLSSSPHGEGAGEPN